MPYKDPQKRKQYNRKYLKKNRKKINAYNRKYKREHKDKYRLKWKEYYYKHHDEILAREKIRRDLNIEEYRKYQRERRIRNIEKERLRSKKYYELHRDERQKYRDSRKDIMKEYSKRHHAENKLYDSERMRLYRKENKEYFDEYYLKRWKENKGYKITMNLRNRLYQILKTKNIIKVDHFNDIIGCTPKFLKNYIESQFMPGMSWNNYGRLGWHIDHIRPCISFDLSKLEEQKKCFNFKNLRPLWYWDNLSKGKKYA